VVVFIKFVFHYAGVFSDHSLAALMVNAGAAAAVYVLFFVRAERAEITYLLEKIKRILPVPLGARTPPAK
jgi:hypothetical protein